MEVKTGGRKGTYVIPNRKFESYIDIVHSIDAFRGRYEDSQEADFERNVGEPVFLRAVDIVPFAELIRVSAGENDYIDILVSIPTDGAHGHNVVAVGRGSPDPGRAEEGELIYTEDLRGKPLSEIFINEEGVSDKELAEFVANVRDAINEVREVHPSLVKALEEKGLLDNPIPADVREVVESYLKEIKGSPTARLLYNDLKALGLLGLKPGMDKLPQKLSLEDVIPKVLKGEEPEAGINIKKIPLNAVVIGVASTDVESSIFMLYYPDRFNLRSSRSIAKDLSASYDYRLYNFLLSTIRNPETVINSETIRNIVSEKIEKKLIEMEARESADVYVSGQAKSIYEQATEALQNKDVEALKSALAQARSSLFQLLGENLSRNELLKKGDILVKKRGSNSYFLRNQLANIGNTPAFWAEAYESIERTKAIAKDRSIKPDEKEHTFLVLAPIPRVVNDDGRLEAKKVYKPVALAVGKLGEPVEVFMNKAFAYPMVFDYPLYKILKGIEKAQSWEEVRRLFSEGTAKVEGLEVFERKVSQYKNVAPVYQDVISHIRGAFKDLIFTPDDAEVTPEEKLEKAKEALQKDPFIKEYMSCMVDFLATRHLLLEEKEVVLPSLDKEEFQLIYDAIEIAGRVREAVEWEADTDFVRKRLKSLTIEEKEEPPIGEAPLVGTSATVTAVEEEAKVVVDSLIESGELDREAQQLEAELGRVIDDFDVDWDEVAHEFDRARLRKRGMSV